MKSSLSHSLTNWLLRYEIPALVLSTFIQTFASNYCIEDKFIAIYDTYWFSLFLVLLVCQDIGSCALMFTFNWETQRGQPVSQLVSKSSRAITWQLYRNQNPNVQFDNLVFVCSSTISLQTVWWAPVSSLLSHSWAAERAAATGGPQKWSSRAS